MAKQTLTGYTSASQVKTQLDKVADLEQYVSKVYINGHDSEYITSVDGVYTLDLTQTALIKCRVIVDWTAETSALNVYGSDEYGEWAYNGEVMVEFDGGLNLDDNTAVMFDAAKFFGSMPTWESGKNVIAVMSDDMVVYATEYEPSNS